MSDNTPQWQKNNKILADIYNKSVEQGFYTDEYMRDVMSPEQAEKVQENRYRMGIEQEPDTGFWGELSDETALAANRGYYNMLKFVGADRAAEDLDRALARNQQWLPPESRGAGGTIGAMIGSGIGSTAAVAPGMIAGAVAGSAIGGPVGTAVGFAAPFMATFATQYNDVKQRNLDNGMDDNSATNAAVVETAALSAVETLLGTVPGIGKLLKGKPTAGLAARTIFKLNKKIGKNATTRFLSNLAKNAIGNGIEEGTEEAIQYLIGVAGESFSEYVGENKDFFEQFGKNFSASDMGYNALAGLVAGTAMGAVPGAIDAGKTNARINRLDRVFKLANEKANMIAASPADAASGSVAVENADAVGAAPVTDGLIVARNDAEAEVIDRYDNMGEESLRSEAARSNLNIDAANADIESLRQILTSNALTQMRRDEVMQISGVDYAPRNVPVPSAAETAPANTPVTAAGGIDRQSLVPAEQSIDITSQTPVGSAAVLDQKTMPQNVPDAVIPQDTETAAPSAPETPSTSTENILSFTNNNAAGNAPVQRKNSVVRENDIDAVAEYQKQIPGSEIFFSPSSNITDDNLRSAAALTQKIYRALDIGKVVNVVTESGNGVFEGASRVVPRRNLVNLDHARTPLQYLHTAMHELVHALIVRNTENYKKFAEKILPLVMGKEQFQRKLNEYIAERQKLKIKVSKSDAIEEFVCDMIADLMQTRHFWEVLSKEDLPLALKLYKAVMDFIKRIDGILDTNSELEAIFKENLAEVERIAAEFIFADTSAENAQTTEVASNKQDVASNKQDVASPVASNEQVSPQPQETSENRKEGTAVPEKGTVKENLGVDNFAAYRKITDQSINEVYRAIELKDLPDGNHSIAGVDFKKVGYNYYMLKNGRAYGGSKSNYDILKLIDKKLNYNEFGSRWQKNGKDRFYLKDGVLSKFIKDYGNREIFAYSIFKPFYDYQTGEFFISDNPPSEWDAYLRKKVGARFYEWMKNGGKFNDKTAEAVPETESTTPVSDADIQKELKNITRPTAESKGITANSLSETAAKIDYADGSVGENFDAHGIAKGKLSEQLQALLNILDNGIDQSKTPLYTAPFTLSEENRTAGGALGTATNGAYKDGIAVLLSEPGKQINTDGVKIVFINDAVSGIIPLLQQRYPGVEFHKLSENKQILETKVSSNQTQTSSRTTAWQTGEQIVSKPEPKRRYFNGTFKAFWDNLKQLPNGTFSKFSFGRVSKKVRDFLKEKGINTTDDYNHIIDNSGISHMEKQHGNKQKEEDRGQLPITEQDFEKIPDIVENYDRIGVDKKDGKTSIVYAKKYPDGTTIFFEEVRTGRRELAAQTIWKMKRGIPNDLLHIFADPKDLNAQSDSAIPPANTITSSSEKSSAGAENTLQKMRNAFENRAEILNSTSKQMLWTDIAREYADGQVLSKEANNAILQEIIDMCLADYQNSETDNILNAITGNSLFNENIRKKAKSAIKAVENKRADDAIQSAKQVSSTITKITTSPVGSNTRIMAFADLPDGEHTVNGKTFTKKGNAFTLDGKTLNAREIEKATRTLNEKFRAKPKDEAAEPQAKAEKIEDFGEKIGGARKDIIRQYADKINLDGKTFAKMFPKPDYAKLLEAGIKLDVLAKLKTAYDMAKNEVKKHRTMDGRQNLTVAKFFAAYAKAALTGEDSVEFRDGNWGFTEHGKRTITVRSQAMEQLLKELGVEYADVDLKSFDITDTWENGVKPEKPRWVVSSKDDESWQKRYRVWAVYGKTGFFDKLNEAIKYFIELVKKHTTLEQPKYKTKIYRSISGEHAGEYYITAVIRGFGDVPLQYFKTGKEARAYYYDHADDLQHQAAEIEEQKKAERKGKFTGRNKPPRLRFNAETLRDRVGIDYRKGKNVSAKELVDTFGFRAIEFGNSVSQKERQIALNALYDSLLDLANALGVSPKAISLNGKLAFAYGARGTGNAEAHYEPERNVINLTKTRGAGNVAHEWWHALDHYFSDSIKYTATSGTYRKDIRGEVKEAFEKLRSYLDNNSKYVVRSERLDAFAKKDYYSVPTELMARAFTDYVSRQLESQGQINDFLSNQVSEADWKGEAETYPYPTGDDAVKLGELLQNLFNTLDEKTDDEGNTIVFSIAGKKGASRMKNAEILLDNLRIAREMAESGKDAKEIKLATGWEKGGDGLWRMEIPDLKISDTALDRSLNYMAGEAGELLDAPELFEAYPELRNINIITVMEHENKLPDNVGGRYDEERKTIFINAKATALTNYEKQILKTAREDIEESWNLSKEELEMRKELEMETDPEKIRKNAYKRIAKLEAIQKEKFQDILIHEMQHAIQAMEGFARGGSLNDESRVSQKSAHKARANALRKYLADAGFEVSSNEAMLLTDETADDTKVEKLWDRLVADGMTEEKYNEIYSRIPLFIGYHNLAGEVEARNAQKRADMSMEERRQSLLDETADVAADDRIYLMEEAGVSEQSALKRKPRNIKDFLNMEGHARPERLDINGNTPTGELFDIFKKYILDRDDIITPEGYKLKAKEGHFYSFCCGKTDKPKGFIEKAANAKEALEMVKNSQVEQSDMAGFQLNRIRNIKTYIDVITDPDFSYRVGDKVVYGKKYDDIKNANGFTSVALDLHNNTLSPIHSGFEVFTEEKLENHDIKWYAELDVDTPLDSALTTGSIASREQLPDRFDKNITRSGQNVNPESAKNAENSSGTFTEDDGSKIKFSIRKDAPPEKTKTGYKVFAVFKSKPGELFPPMVANPGGASTPVGVWLDADAAPRAEDSKTGRPKVQAGGKGTNAGKQTLAYRPGWHLGEVPQAKQFNRLNKQTLKKELFPENFVWAECEFAADVDYQKEAESYGYNTKGNFQHALAGLPKIPVDGYYKYRTNPDPGTEPWYITGAMKVKRLLTDAETNAILKENGYPEMKRQGGKMNLADWGFDQTDFSVEEDTEAAFSIHRDAEQNIEEINDNFNTDIDRQIAGELPQGYIYQLGRPGNILLSTGVPNLPIELSARQLKEKSETAHHPFNIEDVKNLPKMLQNPVGVFLYGNKDKAQNIIIEVQKDGKNFIVGLSLNFQHDGLVVNSIRGLYPKDLHEWLTWIQDGKSLYLDKEKIQKLINQQRRNLADVEYLDLDFIDNIIRNFQNPSVDEKKIAFSVSPASGIAPEVQKLLNEQKPVVSADWVKENRAVYEALYKYVFPSASEISETPSKREMEILNTVLSNGTMSQSEMIAEPYYNDADAKLKDETDNAVGDTISETSDKIAAREETFFEKQKRFWNDRNAKRDLPLWELALRTPIWIAEKLKDVPVVKSIYQAVQTMVDDKQRIYDHLSGNVIQSLNSLAKKEKEMYKKLSDYLFAADRDQTGAGKVKEDSKTGKFIAITADGDKIGSFDDAASAWDALFKNEREQLMADGFSEAAADALYEIRTANYRAYIFNLNNTLRQLRQAGLIDAKSTSFIVTDASQFFPELEAEEKVGDIDLFALMREMGDRSGYYMPRKRKPGRYLLWISKAGEPSRLETFDSRISRTIAANKYSKQGYHTESLLSKSADQDMLNQVNPAALMDIINQAASRAKDFIKGNVAIEMKDYTTKDGVVEKNLVVSGKGIDKALRNLLKEMGGKFWDSDKSWHFVNPDAGLQSKLSDIIESKVTNDMKLASLMQTTLFENIRDMIRENSSSSFKLARRNAKGDAVVRGYIEDPIRALALYYSGIAGGTARNIMAKKMYAAYGGMDFDREKFIADHIPADIDPDSDKYPRAKLEAIAAYYREVKRRAIDSSRQPNIAKYMDKYIKDMLRNTDAVERIVGTMKGWAAIYMLGKLPSALNNTLSAGMVVPAMINRFTGQSILKTSGDFGKGIGLYWKYWAYNLFGKGEGLKGFDKTLFDIIHKNHWDGSEFAQEAFAANAGYLDKVTQFSAKYGLWFFGMAEQANRAASIRAAAIAIAEKKGVDLSKLSALELRDILLEAKDISDKANGVYNKSNKQSFVRGGGLHAIADGFMLFQQYSVNLFQIYADLLKNRNYKALAYMSAATGLVAGVSGDIALRVLASTLGALGVGDGDDDKDFDEQFYGFIGDKFGRTAENAMRFGIPSLLDINLSATYQNALTDMHSRKSVKPELFNTVPPAMFLVERLTDAYDYGTTGQWWKASETLLPAVAANVSRGVRESIYGVTDRADRIRKDVNDREIRPDINASLLRMMGFNPVSISEKTEALWNEKKIRAKYADKRKELYTRLRDWNNSQHKDSAELAQITADIDEYNARANRSKRRIPLIDEKSIERALESKDNKFFKDGDED